MNQSRFFIIFTTTHILFIMLQIHKHTQIVRYSYQKQELEQQIQLLNEKKEHLVQLLCEQKNHDAINKYAQTNLGMKPLQLHQIKKLQS